MTPARPELKPWLGLGAITLGALVLRCWGVGSQPFTDDDLNVALSAANYIDTGHLGPTMWNHPPLRNLLVYGSLKLLGPTALGLKLPSLFFGTLAVWLTGLVALRLFQRLEVALIAAGLLAIDSLHIDFSRQGVHEVYMGALTLAGLWCALRFQAQRRGHWVVLSGLAFGLGLSAKWDVAVPLAITLGYLVISISRERDRALTQRRAELAVAIVALTVVPLATYLLVFTSWLADGHTPVEFLWLHGAMLKETLTHQGYNPADLELDIRAWLWFVKPVAYASFSFAGAHPVVFLGISNPLVWLFTLPAVAVMARDGWRQGEPASLMVVALFAAMYLPLVLTSRPIWVHTAFTLLPFGFMAIAHLVTRPGWSRGLLVAQLAGALLISAPLYLLATGAGLDSPVLRPVVERYRPQNER